MHRCEQSITHSRTLRNTRSLPAMEKSAPERPIREVRRGRLRELLKEFGGPKGLSVQSDTPDTHFTAIEKGRRAVGDELATKLEERCEKPFGWMDLPPSESREVAEVKAQPPRELGIRDALHLLAPHLYGASPFVIFTSATALSRFAHHPEEVDEIAVSLEALFRANGPQSSLSVVQDEGSPEWDSSNTTTMSLDTSHQELSPPQPARRKATEKGGQA